MKGIHLTTDEELLKKEFWKTGVNPKDLKIHQNTLRHEENGTGQFKLDAKDARKEKKIMSKLEEIGISAEKVSGEN